MLDDLVQAIETLKQRIREHGPYVGAYESRTRVSLIDPMLSALGWDVADPALVQIEPRTTNGWADYALLGSNGRPVIFVEAKKLADRDSHVQQAVGYAVSENMGGANVPYCACTNGDNWEVFDVFSQKPVLKVSISTEDAAKCALQFLGLWRRSLSDGSLTPAVEPVVGLVEPSSVEPPPDTPPSPTLQRRPDIVVPTVRTPPPEPEWTPLTGDFQIYGDLPPSEIRLPDGATKAISAWRSVVVESALWLNQEGKLTLDDCPIPMGGIRHLLSLDGVHRTGTKFHSPVKVGQTGMILEGSLTATDSVRFARKLWQDFGQDPAQVHLKLK